MVGPFLPDDEKIPALREALPATAAGIYLNAGSAGPLPRETARAMAELEGMELRTGRADRATFEDVQGRMDEARGAIAAVLVTDPSRIAITHGASDGMNVAAWAIDWQPGDRAVTSDLEHPGGLAGLWSLRQRFGIDLAIAAAGAGALGAGDPTAPGAVAAGDPAAHAVVDAFERAILPGTKLVSLSHVSWATGLRLPVREIAEIAHARGALVAVDGAQAAGAIPLAAEELGVDFYAVPAQKWLLGPEGAGALYAAPSVFDRVRTSFAGGFSLEAFDLQANYRLWPDARRFEGSNYHQPSVLGFARSCAWLSMYVGLPWIYERTARLARSAHEMLGEVPGVELLTPAGAMAGIVTFRIAGWTAEAALEELERRTFVIARIVAPLDAIRISVGFYNTEGDLRRFRDGVALLAEHTPDTLPVRPRIVVIEGGGE